jgi:hypothetical protein
MAYPKGPANNQHAEGNTSTPHLVPPWHCVIPSRRIATRRNLGWLYFDVKHYLLYVKKHYEDAIATMVYRLFASGEVEKIDLKKYRQAEP